jgi:S-formylglutathione hydrolase FrmB
MQPLQKGCWVGAALAIWLAATPPAPAWGSRALDRLNRKICGQVLDFTHNHGQDQRIWSDALGQKRDVYVYLPPDFDPQQLYPIVLWLHGVGQDEQSFLSLVEPFDEYVSSGQMPPVIIVAPDGSLHGRPMLGSAGSFFLNSKAGRFEDYLMADVWGFLVETFPIRPERGAHVLAGASMGGFAAYNLGIKYRDRFGILIGILPPLNLRWEDCHGRYFGNFDPCCWGWKEKIQPYEAVARFFCGLITIRQKRLIHPLFGRHGLTVEELSQQNPIEMLVAHDVRPGEFEMYVGYGDKDEFNVDAQVESFVYVANQRGLTVTVGHVAKGRHNPDTGIALMPSVVSWLAPLLAPYTSPPLLPAPTPLPGPADAP